ncbi:predicted protein [Postia placenta Mad-698-R]|nr:predicted protein [Postia placenta Mad-698-R]
MYLGRSVQGMTADDTGATITANLFANTAPDAVPVSHSLPATIPFQTESEEQEGIERSLQADHALLDTAIPRGNHIKANDQETSSVNPVVSSDSSDTDSNKDKPKKRRRKDCSARALELERKEIIEVAYIHYKLQIMTWEPWTRLDQQAVEAWGDASEELGVGYVFDPRTQECTLIKVRAAQIRGVGKYFKAAWHVPMVQMITTVQAAIEEWKTGMHQKVEFRTTLYESVFQSHLAILRKWDEFSATQSQAPQIMHQDLLRTLSELGKIYIWINLKWHGLGIFPDAVPSCCTSQTWPSGAICW